MIYDPNLMGTPIVLLQIPETVMKQISSDMAKGLASTTFTQDGLELRQLSGKVAAEDYKVASETQSEVRTSACFVCTTTGLGWMGMSAVLQRLPTGELPAESPEASLPGLRRRLPPDSSPL